MFPSASNDIFQAWPTLKNKVCKYAEENLKNKQHKLTLEEFKKNKLDDYLFIKVLTACLPPGTVTQKFRPNYEESLNACVRAVGVLFSNYYKTNIPEQ